MQIYEPAVKMDKVIINDLSGDIYTINANDNVAANCKYLWLITIQAALNQKQTNTGGLAKLN